MCENKPSIIIIFIFLLTGLFWNIFRPLWAADTVLQPGPEDGIDAFVTNVYGTPGYYESYKNFIRVGGWGDYYYGLIRFKLESLPTQAQKATIRLHAISQKEVGVPMFLDRVTSYWDEAVSWNTKPAYNYYRSLPAAIPSQPYEIDITDLYNDWQSGKSTNYGIQLRPNSTRGTPWNEWSQFYSSDYMENLSLRPELIVSPINNPIPPPPTNHKGAVIAVGWYHTVALKSDGTVWAWGINVEGQLGDGTTINHTTPVQVSGLGNVFSVAAGWGHTVALKNDGTVWTWGHNFNGQLGDGTTDTRLTPSQVAGLSNVIGIAAGWWHTVALKSDGTVWAWGWGNNHTPTQVSGLTGIVAIAAGWRHTVALKSDGTVWSWGGSPSQVSGLSNVASIAAGWDYTVALKNGGTVWAWGDNSSGQLGDGTTTNRGTPVQASGLGNVTAIATGSWHTVGLKNDGTVWTWGYNEDGQLGNGATTNRTTPSQVTSLTGIIAIAAGNYHTVALKSDGTVWAWGFNDDGLLGDGTVAIVRTTPGQVLGPGGIGYLNLLQTTPPTPNDSIVIALEEPAPGSVYSGVSNVRGWAVAPQGLQKIELYVDGALQGHIPLGGKRTDVGNAYPSYPGAAESGFAMALNYSNLAAGTHTLMVRAIDAAGGGRDASTTFTVVRFADSFMADPMAVNLDNATINWGGNTITIQNLLAVGKPYNVQLNWRPAIQGFAITQINSVAPASTQFDPSEEQPTDPASTSVTASAALPQGSTLSAIPTAAGDNIVMALEEPAPGSTYSGISNARGWAVAPTGMQKIELYVDGAFQGHIPLGGKRTDIGTAYPGYPGAAESGFAMAFNYSNLAAGMHTLTVRAYDANGGARDASATFTVARFANSFMADPTTVNVNNATISRMDSTIMVENLLAEGKYYNVRLDWRQATQGFALTGINPK